MSRRMLSWKSGGWILLAATALAVLATWRFLDIMGGEVTRAVGDGKNVASYGYDLEPCLVPRNELVAAGFPKDGLPRLDYPQTIPADEVQRINEAERGKFLVSRDLVVGLSLRGARRAYPLRMLAWHEVVNDTLGGLPIAVTYSPLSGTVVAFDRRLSGGTKEFGHAGLLWQSNLVLFDRKTGSKGESLWSQIQSRAIAGPAAGEGTRLRVLFSQLVPWSRWKEHYPDTDVLAPVVSMKDRYKREPYGSYLGSDLLRFPVSPLPPEDGLRKKSPVLLLRVGGEQAAFSLERIAARADDEGRTTHSLSRAKIGFECFDDPLSVWIDVVAADVSGRGSGMATSGEVPLGEGNRPRAGGERPRSREDTTISAIHAFWFALYAAHPDARALAF